VTFISNDTWFRSLPSCQVQVPCGQGEHTLRWEAGGLELAAHPDAEAERVLAALGGDKALCVRVAEIWDRHADDLMVLQVGPRDAADRLTVDWEHIPKLEEFSAPGQSGWVATTPRRQAMAMHATRRYPPAAGQQFAKDRRTTADLVTLLALGPAFSFRLSGQVAAAHAERLDPANRPALIAAVQGRLAPAVERWTGIDPDQVTVALLSDPSTPGTAELTGHGAERRLLVMVPADWLASVWACGLAVVDRHLVVATVRPGWPDAAVLALPAPGKPPVPLTVHGTPTPDGLPAWTLRGAA